jgi:hypothetical protein
MDQFSAVVKAEANGDPFENVERIAQVMERAMGATGLGAVKSLEPIARAKEGSIRRPTIGQLASAAEENNLTLDYVRASLTMSAGRSVRGKYEVSVVQHQVVWFGKGPRLSVTIDGPTKVIVDGLEQAAQGALQRLNKLQTSASAVESPTGNEAVAPSSLSASDTSIKPRNPKDVAPPTSSPPPPRVHRVRDALKRHATNLVVGVVTTVIAGYILWKLGWI